MEDREPVIYRSPAETIDAILAATSPDPAAVLVADYDDAWPKLFAALAGPVRGTLAILRRRSSTSAAPLFPDWPRSRSSTSTSSSGRPPACRARSSGCGRSATSTRVDKGIPGREGFLWPPGAPPRHLYVVVAGSEPLPTTST